MPKQRIGIFGGTFDPVHCGHIRLASEFSALLRQQADSHVHIIPCHIPPHRDTPLANARQRLQMLQLAFSTREGFTLDERELRRDAPSYSLTTLASIQAEYPSSELVLAVGADAFNGFRRWHRWRDILEIASLVVFTRGGVSGFSQGAADLLKEYGARQFGTKERGGAATDLSVPGQIALLEMSPIAVSSTQVRRRIKHNESLAGLLPQAVIDYIDREKPYDAELMGC